MKTWLRTERPVVSIKPENSRDLSQLENALQCGVVATKDPNRSGFYDIEVAGHWYYIHIPERLPRVYVVSYSIRKTCNTAVLSPTICLWANPDRMSCIGK